MKNKKFLGGDELTWVDFYGYEVFQLIDLVYEGKFFTQYPLFAKYRDRFASIKKVQCEDYLHQKRSSSVLSDIP